MIKEEKPFITYILIALNVIIFLTQTVRGGSESSEVLINMGAAYTPYIIENHEWYRLFTAMFLHIGVEHIAGNMICLIAIGPNVEAYFGKFRYLLIYVLAGIGGNVLSLIVELFTYNFYLTAGASGAISGLLGAMIIFAMDPALKKNFPLPRVLVCIVLVLIPGFGAQKVNIVAHLGGIITGFALSYIFYYNKRSRGESYYQKTDTHDPDNPKNDYYNFDNQINDYYSFDNQKTDNYDPNNQDYDDYYRP